MSDEPEYFSMAQAAKQLKIHRVTLLRMEQRNLIAKAKWKRNPQPHRVYTQKDINAIQKVIDKQKADKLDEGMKFVD